MDEGWVVRRAARPAAVQYAAFAVAGDAPFAPATAAAAAAGGVAAVGGRGFVAVGPGRPAAENPAVADPSVLDGSGLVLPQVRERVTE